MRNSIGRGLIVAAALLAACIFIARAMAVDITSVRVATGLNKPLYVTAPPGDTDRLFIVEQHDEVSSANIRILDLTTGTVSPTPFLTIPNVDITPNDAGLFSLAFHPDYANNGYFYANFNPAGGPPYFTETRRYQANGPNFATATTADPGTADIIFSQPEIGFSHNTNWLGFGPDDFLYVATGDGACCFDPGNAGQDLNSLKGKILRLDVNGDDFPGDSQRDYAIPQDNPFVGQTGADEIWAYGLRNPWRASFDRLTGDLYLGDVGQNDVEEIDVIPAGMKGLNFGWLPREGTQETPDFGGPKPAGAIDPIYDYPHGNGSNQGFSVTGGSVYRGPITEFQGTYFFADFIRGRVWSLRWDGSDPSTFDGTNFVDFTDWTDTLLPDDGSPHFISSFGEDAAGNLYILDWLGDIFKIVEAPPERTWSQDAGGNWNNSSNWDGGAPNGNDDLAIFGNAISTKRTVFTDSAVTVSSIQFDNANRYIIAGLGSVNLEAASGNAIIDVIQGDHEFQVTVNLNDDTDVAVPTGSSLVFNNTMNLAGNTLMKTGDGDLIFNNLLSTEGGMVSIGGGTVSGGGVVAGNVENDGGVLSPGNSPGVIEITGDYRQGADGSLLVEIAGTVAGTEHDLLVVGGVASLDGALEVVLLSDFQPQGGDEFVVLDFATTLGEFDAIRLPALSSGLAWDDSALYASGALSVVPEPVAYWLMLAGAFLTGIGMRRRKNCLAQSLVHRRSQSLTTSATFPFLVAEVVRLRTINTVFALGIALFLVHFPSIANAQLPVTSNLMVHFDASDINANGTSADNPADGANVTTWIDMANSNVAAESTNPPIFRPFGINGNPAVVFNENGEANQILTVPDDNTLDVGTGSFTAFVVAATDENGGNNAQVFWDHRDAPGTNFRGSNFFLEFRSAASTGDGSGPGMTLAAQVNTLTSVIGYNTPADDDPGGNRSAHPLIPDEFEDGQPRVYSVVFDRVNDGDGRNMFFGIDSAPTILGARDDGTSPPPPVGDSFSNNTFKIGWSDLIAGAFLNNGRIGEMILYDTELSSAQYSDVLNYLFTKYDFPAPGAWDVSEGGDWQIASHWVGGIVPNSSSATATFGIAITSPSTVFTDQDVTVETIRFDHALGYGVSGGGTIHLDSAAGNALIEVAQGDHQFQAIVKLVDPTEVDVTGGASLAFNNSLDLNGNVLTKTGPGTLSINNVLTIGTGSIDLQEGTISGHGTVGGDVTNDGGTVSPGNSPGVMAIGGDYQQGPLASLLLEIGGSEAGSEHDVFQVDGTAYLDGALEVVLVDGFIPEQGDQFVLFELATVVGGFEEMKLPTLAAGLSWDASALHTEGSLLVSTIPEPGVWSLLLSSIVVFGVAFRRCASPAALL